MTEMWDSLQKTCACMYCLKNVHYQRTINVKHFLEDNESKLIITGFV